MPKDNQTQTSGSYGSTSLTQNNPYNRGAMDAGMSELQRLFKGGNLAPNVKSNPWQMQGLGGMVNSARQGGNALGSAVNQMSGLMRGGGNVSSANQNMVGNQAMQNSYAENNLADIAAGKQLGMDDSIFEDALGRATSKAADEAMFRAGARGRGSGSYTDASIAGAVGDTQANARLANLESGRNRMMSANQMMDASKQGRLGLGLNAFNSGSAIQAANQDRRMSAAGMLPGLSQARTGLYDMMAGAGDARQALQTGNRSGQSNNLMAYLNSLGAFQPYGSTKNTTAGTMSNSTEGPNNMFGKILGGLGGLGSLFG